jgi:xanthine phosphoribosyltransferase
MKKKYYSWNDIETMCIQIVNQLYADNWRPDYIVGLTRGGNVPATIISNMTNIPADTLQVNFRDNGLYTESNCWMAEDAYGYGVLPTKGYFDSVTGSIAEKRKNILIVDDINDSGKTFDWIVTDWQSSCVPGDVAWKEIWGNSVRFAVLTENLSSNFELVNYYCDTVNKAEEDVWLVYPWEDVGQYGR